MASTIGRLPTPDEYLAQWKKIDANAADTYKYLNFDQARLDTHIPDVFERYGSFSGVAQVPAFTEKAHSIALSDEMVAAAKRLHGN